MTWAPSIAGLPQDAPILSGKDAWNETGARASIVRRLARWQTWAWARWRRYSPCDPFAPVIDASVAPTWPTSAGASAQTFPAIFVWESGSHATSVRLWCYVKRDAGSTTGKIDFVDGNRAVLVASVNIDNTSLGGSGVLSGWVNVDVPVAGPNTIIPTLSRTSGSGTVYWHGVSGWWNRPPNDFAGGSDLSTVPWQPLDKIAAQQNRSLSAGLLRALVLQGAYLLAYYPRPIVQKWWGDGMYLTAAAGGGSTQTVTVGRYKVPFSPQCPDVEFAIHCRGDNNGGGSNQPKARIKVNGVQVGTDVTTTTSWAWYQRTYTYGLSSENVYEVTIEAEFDVLAQAGDEVRIASFCGYEAATALTATQLGLPVGTPVGSSFIQIPYSRITAGASIFADTDADGYLVGVAALAANMIWLHANRRRRNLIADGTRWAGHRNTYSSDDGYPLSDGASDSSLTAAYRWGKCSDLSTAYDYASWIARTIPHASGWAENLSGAAFVEGYSAGSRYGGRVYGGAAITPAVAWGWVENDARGIGWTGNNGSPQTYWGKSPDPTTGSGGNRNPLFAGQATREKHADEPAWTNP